jgi:hypothetical protein
MVALVPVGNIAMKRRQIPVRGNLACRNSASYCTPVVRDSLVVSLR